MAFGTQVLQRKALGLQPGVPHAVLSSALPSALHAYKDPLAHRRPFGKHVLQTPALHPLPEQDAGVPQTPFTHICASPSFVQRRAPVVHELQAPPTHPLPAQDIVWGAHLPSVPQISTSPALVQRDVDGLHSLQSGCPCALTRHPFAQVIRSFHVPAPSQVWVEAPVGSQRAVPGEQVPMQPPLAQTYWQGCAGTQ